VKLSADCESRLKAPSPGQKACNVQSEAVTSLHMSLKTEIQKAKRALEGGSVDALEQIGRSARPAQPADLQALSDKTAELARGGGALKLMGFRSRVATLERRSGGPRQGSPGGVHQKRCRGRGTQADGQGEPEAQSLPRQCHAAAPPAGDRARHQRRAARAHAGSEPRRSRPGRGLQIETERLQKRLDLLESSLLCYV
jgi:hypothetical protein